LAFDPEVAQLLEEIRQDREHSASWLSLQAIGTLRLAAGKSTAHTTADFLNEVKGVARDLADARPPMAPISNLVAQWFYDIAQEPEVEKGLDSLRAFAILRGEKIIKARKGALNRVAEHGSQLVEDDDILISCSDSTTVIQSLKMARLAGKEFGVYVAESRTSDGKAYGEAMAEKMRAEQIPVKVILDNPNSIGDSMAKSSRALVGADSILDNGSLINGSPTLTIAEAAKERKIPFYVVCETTKFSALRLVGRHLWLEEGFEVIPPHLITRIITEDGLMNVDQAMARAKLMVKYLQALWE
jgi:translation initiation factor 2B subunit (eIF-2B alpha/beta/delta family)